MTKTLSIEAIADKFLKHLLTYSREDYGAMLHDYLYEQNIYFDAGVLEAVMTLLNTSRLIEEIPGTGAYISYDRSGDLLQSLSKIEARIPQCKISDYGRHFVENGQKLDKVSVIQAREDRKKYREWIISFVLGVFTVIVSEQINKYLERNREAQKSNESSTVRPRLDPRQRPEPGESVDTTTKRSGGSRRFNYKRIY